MCEKWENVNILYFVVIAYIIFVERNNSIITVKQCASQQEKLSYQTRNLNTKSTRVTITKTKKIK